MKGSKHLEHNCVWLVLLIDVIVQWVDDLVEAKSHAVLEVLRMIFRVGNASAGSKHRIDLLEQGFLKELQELASRDHRVRDHGSNPGNLLCMDFSKQPLPIRDQILANLVLVIRKMRQQSQEMLVVGQSIEVMVLMLKAPSILY